MKKTTQNSPRLPPDSPPPPRLSPILRHHLLADQRLQVFSRDFPHRRHPAQRKHLHALIFPKQQLYPPL